LNFLFVGLTPEHQAWTGLYYRLSPRLMMPRAASSDNGVVRAKF